jgi:hypothetical protein
MSTTVLMEGREIARRGRRLQCQSCRRFALALMPCGCGLLICADCVESRAHRLYTPAGKRTEHCFTRRVREA